MDGDDAADRLVRRIHRGEPDQVGVVIFILAGCGQLFARNVKFEAIEPFGVLARGDVFQGRDQMAFGLTGARHLEVTRAILCRQRPIALHGQRIFGKGPQLHRATHAMGGADPGDANLRWRHQLSR